MARRSPSRNSEVSVGTTAEWSTGSRDGSVSESATGSQFATLTYEQIQKLLSVVDGCVEIDGKGNFPTLIVRVRTLISEVVSRLERNGMEVKAVKINGGVAGHAMADADVPYNDLDLIYCVDLQQNQQFEVAKSAVLDAIANAMPPEFSRDKPISPVVLADAYVRKMVKVNDGGDRWSLVTLNNDRGRCIEMKFCDQMRRQYEFSVDSFQIDLGSVLSFYQLCDALESRTSSGSRLEGDGETNAAERQARPVRPLIGPKFFPFARAECVYGPMDLALYHLNQKLIDTKHPEEIRGGGLLKYCYLVAKGYQPVRPTKLKVLERYICSRFFIDFPADRQQHAKLNCYLHNHFSDDLYGKFDYLLVLSRVIFRSAVCLMPDQRDQILIMIMTDFAYPVWLEIQRHQYEESCHRGYVYSVVRSGNGTTAPISSMGFCYATGCGGETSSKNSSVATSFNLPYWRTAA